MRRAIACLLAAFLLAAPAASVAQKKKPKQKNADVENIGRRDVNRGSWNLWSPERELELGQQMATDTERSVALLNDPVVVSYVQEVAERISRNSDSQLPVQVRVVDSGEVNAFALPGGHFFVNTGLLLEAQTEAELASVIAHEIAHVAARHATKQMTKAQIWNFLSIPLAFVGGPAAYWIHQGLTIAVPLTFLKFSRNAEREADFLGLQYHHAAGYDPVAFVDFFERMKRLEKDKKGGIAKAFSTHPMTKDRILAAGRTIEQVLPEREAYVVNTSSHDEMRDYLGRLLGERKRTEEAGPVLRKRTDTKESEKNESH